MANQALEIFDYIKQNPGARIEDIVEGTGWNMVVVEAATHIMLRQGLIEEIGRTEWNNPKFKVKGE